MFKLNLFTDLRHAKDVYECVCVIILFLFALDVS